MNKPIELIEMFENIAKHPQKSVLKSMESTGKKAIGCFPIYVPEEIIYAGGFLPVGMWGGQTELKLADKYLQSFCCSVMRANLEFAIKGTYNMLTAVVTTTFCDSLKALYKNWKAAIPDIAVIGIAYPQNRHIDAGFRCMLSEFDCFRSEIDNISGNKMTDEDIDKSFGVYEDYRHTMREFVELVQHYPITIDAKSRHYIIKASYFMDKKEYTVLLKDLIAVLKAMPNEKFDGIRVVLSGIMVDAEPYLDLFAENKIAVVADDLAQESRQFRTLTRAEGTSLEKMAYHFIDLEGCAFAYDPLKVRGKMLIEMTKKYKADAVVFCQMKFCEMEEFDFPFIKTDIEEVGVKMLYIEADQQIDSAGQLRNRIQSFSEINKK